MPDRASNDYYQWDGAKRHMQGLMMQARYVVSAIEPIHNLTQWIRSMFESLGGIEAMKYVKGFTSEDFLDGWREYLKSPSKAGWGAGWVVHARSARKKDKHVQQEHEAKAKAVAERMDVAAMAPARKKLVEPIGNVLDDPARDAAWLDVPEAERNALRDIARGEKGSFRLSWDIGERCAKQQWWDAKQTTSNR